MIFQQFVLPLQIIMQQQKRTQNEKNTINNHRAFDDGAIVFGAKKGQKQRKTNEKKMNEKIISFND